MSIFNWWASENGAEFTGVSDLDRRKIRWYDKTIGDPLPRLVDWVPPTLTQYRGGNGKRKLRPILDSASSASLNIVSTRARVELQDIWDRHVLLYPVILDQDQDNEFFVVVVKTTLDCLDRAHSSGPLQKYGPTPELFASVHTWEFDDECVGGADIFTIPDSSTNIFVSERFKRRVAESGLKGFCLRNTFWDESPWIS